ncbi:hypothetical protein DIPPA_35550 [Diplonema papillatum]|nr:hypothetical protein DIPPA_35550 [Diplonema papillatum]
MPKQLDRSDAVSWVKRVIGTDIPSLFSFTANNRRLSTVLKVAREAPPPLASFEMSTRQSLEYSSFLAFSGGKRQKVSAGPGPARDAVTSEEDAGEDDAPNERKRLKHGTVRSKR